MTQEQKRMLAMLLIERMGDMVETWGEYWAPEQLAGVAATEIRQQLAVWARRLPGIAWDTRLGSSDPA